MLAAPALLADLARLAMECTLLGNDAIEHRRQQHQVDESGIELRSAAGCDDVGGGCGTAATAIATIVGDGVEGVREGNDAGRERYRMAAQAIGISGAIPPFVVTAHACRQIGIERVQWSENGGASIGVSRDRAALGGGETRALVDDVEQRFVNLADVMKERDAFDDLSLVLVELRRVGEHEGIRGDTADVAPGVGVVGVDGVEQRLEARGGKAFGGFTAPPLDNEEDAGEDARGGGKGRSHGAVEGKIRTFSTSVGGGEQGRNDERPRR